MFEFNLGLSPMALHNLFVRNSKIHNYNTRNKNKLRSAIGKHTFIYKNCRYIVNWQLNWHLITITTVISGNRVT